MTTATPDPLPEITVAAPEPLPEITVPPLDDPRLYINRELSALEFFQRVLEEAQDERNPLLERVKFLAIVGSNLDEFFMVRVAGLKQQIAAGVLDLYADGLTPAEQLAAIRKAAIKLMNAARDCLNTVLLPQLQAAGIHLLNYAELNEKQLAHVNKYFDEIIFPILTPLAVDPGRPFPHISNLSLNLAIMVRDPLGPEHFSRLKVPDTLPRLVPIKRSSGGVRKDGTVPYHHYFVWLEQVIAANLPALYPGLTIVETHPFRVIRDADLAIQELEADDLLQSVEESVHERRFGSVVKLTINPGLPPAMLKHLSDHMAIEPNDIYPADGVLGWSSLMALTHIDRYDLKDPPWVPATPPPLTSKAYPDIFSAIRAQRHILLHHPYDSFAPVLDFLQTAAADPDVLAIKQTLYRVGYNSPVVEALLEASQNGKQVAVLVELKARFDEASNINWAKALEAEGVHVVYGLVGLKTHSKVALVVRQEGDGIRRYLHLSTGNYNPVTAQLYTDFGYFTCDEDLGADATDLFNYLTGYSNKSAYRKLLVAPVNLRHRLTALIEREIEHHREGRGGQIIFKLNSISDPAIIQQLYRASQAGVSIDLLVRGICCLRPGWPGVSENIRVTSLVGRFLEHSRLYYFHNGGAEEIYLGSADLMTRNLDRRVEILYPILDPAIIQHLRGEVLQTYLGDNVKTRRLRPDGAYERLQPAAEETPLNAQQWLLTHRPT